MIIKSWRHNFDTWSYVHWIGAAYLTATECWQVAAFWIVLWEWMDVTWSYAYPNIIYWYFKAPYPNYKNILRCVGLISYVLDRRGFSYGDIIMGWAGIMTCYAHVGVGWWAGLACAACVFLVVELSRE